MAGVIITPRVVSSLLIKDVQTQRGVDNFRSLLLFFTDFMCLLESRPPAMIQIGNPDRWLNSGPDVDFLSKNRQLFGSVCPPEKSIGDAAIQAQNDFAIGNIQSEDIGERDVFISREMTKNHPQKHTCLTIEFLDGLVIPPEDCSYEDILKFKEDRSAELKEFWASVFGLATQIDWLADSDPELELRKSVANSLNSYNRVSAETWGKRVRDSLSIQFTLDKAAIATLTGAAIGSSKAAGIAIGSSSPIIPFSVATAIGILGMIRFSVDLLPSKPPMSQGASAMSYLSKVNALQG